MLVVLLNANDRCFKMLIVLLYCNDRYLEMLVFENIGKPVLFE